MKKLINIIKSNGVHKNYTDELNQYIETVNVFGLVFIFLTIPFIFIFHKSFYAQIIIVIPIFFQIISFILLKLKFHKTGRIIFSINTSTSVYLIAALVYIDNGTDGMAAKFLILGSAILPFITFKKEEWKYLVLVLILILAYLLTFNYVNNMLNLKSIHENLDSPALRIMSVITAFFMFTVVLYYYKKIITEQNLRLKDFNTNLKQKNEELEAISEELRQNNEELLTAKEEISKSEKKYRLLFEKNDEATLIIDKNKFIDCNEATVKMLGFNSKNELLNVHPSKLSPQKQPDGKISSEKADEMINIAYKKGTNKFEWTHTRANGENFPVEVWFTAIPFKNKTVIHTVWRDLTEIKEAEKEINEKNSELEAISEELRQNNEELLYSKERLKESIEKYNLVANNMTDFIWMVDLDLSPKYISPSCSEFIGYSEKEMNTLSIKNIHTKKSITTFLELRSEIIKTKNNNFKKHFEIEYIHKEGYIFPAEVYGFVVSNSNGKPIGIGGVSRDITEQKKAQDELKKSKEKIEISHDNTLADMRYAQTIQKSLLTSKNIIDSYFDNYFIIYNSKDVVSGDFYYVVKKNKYIIFAVADCTGHGVAGGFISMLGISYLHEIVSIKEVNNAGTVLKQLREKVKNTFITFGSENPNGMDIAFCAIDTKTNILQYSGAYNPLLIIRNEKLIEYKATRNPIGFNYVEKEFENHEIQLQNNDLIYLFSDGFQDQIGGVKGKKYLSKNFKKLIVQNSHLPMNEQKSNLEKTFKEWKGNLEQVDDVTIMGVKWQI